MKINLSRTAFVCSSAFLCWLCGCGAGESSISPVPVPGAALHGTVFGGQQPVPGSTVQLFATGIAGYGSNSTPLISTTVKTDAGGNFNITGLYNCPSASTQVYIASTGGGGNDNLSLISALGSCGQLSSSTTINIDEVSTVAAVWALAPFMNGPAAIGAPLTNLSGLQNAMRDVRLLVDTATGRSPGPSAGPNVIVPSAEINTLANILAACVNSTGGVAGDQTPCGILFSAASSGGAPPADTVSAALNIARHPASNVNSVFLIASAVAPFSPSLAIAPKDFSIAVRFSSGGIQSPSAIAIDAYGNAWIANRGGNSLTEYSSDGNVLSGNGYTNGLNVPSAIAVGMDGSLWVTNSGNDSVSRFSASGSAYAAPYTGRFSSPNAVAIDANGTAWVTNAGDGSVTTISSTGNMANYNLGASPLAVATTPR